MTKKIPDELYASFRRISRPGDYTVSDIEPGSLDKSGALGFVTHDMGQRKQFRTKCTELDGALDANMSHVAVASALVNQHDGLRSAHAPFDPGLLEQCLYVLAEDPDRQID